jgi:hypothetical protein
MAGSLFSHTVVGAADSWLDQIKSAAQNATSDESQQAIDKVMAAKGGKVQAVQIAAAQDRPTAKVVVFDPGVGPAAEGAVHFMPYFGSRSDHQFVAGPHGAHRQVYLFGIKEEDRVVASNLLDQTPPQEHDTTINVGNFLSCRQLAAISLKLV